MIRVSYNISPVLRDTLNKIDSFRQKILLTPLSPQIEMRLRFEAKIDRMYWALALKDATLSRGDIVKVVTQNNTKKRFAPPISTALKYKKGLDHITQNWLAENKEFNVKSLVTLYRMSFSGELAVGEEMIKEILDYLQANPENPVISAAIAHIQFAHLKPFSEDNDGLNNLLSYLFLYKYGYDFRGLLVLEEYWKRDLAALKDVTETTFITEGLTLWLTYFAKAVVTQLEKVSQNLSSPDFKLDYLPVSFWELNNRQKEILTTLEEPKKTMTNREVQETFLVSQITASRDLAKLASLGLLFTHGKGRSVKYSKI